MFTFYVLSLWRLKGIRVLRILFGLVWAVDAWYKLQLDFIDKFTNYVTGTLVAQSHVVKAWINFWIEFIEIDPRNFAHFVAVAEIEIAIGLISAYFAI